MHLEGTRNAEASGPGSKARLQQDLLDSIALQLRHFVEANHVSEIQCGSNLNDFICHAHQESKIVKN